MTNQEKAKLRRELAEMRDNIAYMQERVRLSSAGEATVIEKNLTYARKKEEKLCKLIGYGDSTNLSTTSQ